MGSLNSKATWSIILTGSLVFGCSCRKKESQKANDGTIHIETHDERVTKAAITIAIWQKRITEGEIDTRKRVASFEKRDQQPLVSDRIILTDICMGSDQYEHEQLGEGSIICLLGISKDPAELPFARVYVERKNNKGFDLPLIGILPPATAKLLKTDGSIGNNIWGGLYWVPRVHKLDGKLLVDFSANRTQFGTGISFPFSKSIGKGLIDKNSDSMVVNFQTMKEVIEREYPGMVLTQEILEEIEKHRKP
jgi:hypothetical protein